MCHINYAQLSFNHVVIFTHEDTVFATGKENDTQKTRLFLIFNQPQTVYTRNGVASSWERLNPQDSKLVLDRIQADIASGIPAYKFNGSLQAITGGVPQGK